MVRATQWPALVTVALVACGGADAGAPDAPVDGGAVCGDGVVDPGEVCDDGTNDRLGGGCQPGCSWQDDSDRFFAIPLHEIEVVLADADWDTLRRQTKSRHVEFAGATCRDQPIVSPYTWAVGDVRVDGVAWPLVGVRKKGHLGSQSTLRPSLKLDFDRAVDGRRFFGLTRLALNNNKQDPSLARTCVAYQVFAAAGVPAPRCTHAHVTVNGEDLGVFTALEEVDDDFLARHFADPSGNLYEGTASDFRPEFIGGFERENNPGDPSRADLTAVLDALTEFAADDAGLLAALAPRVDLASFYRFWAVEGLVWHRDGYAGNANNFFVYADPAAAGQLRFLPWGADATLSPDNRAAVPDSVLAFSALAQRLYAIPSERARYYAALDAALAQAWDVPTLTARVDAIGVAADAVLGAAERATRSAAAATVKTTIRERAAVIAAARAGGEPAWTEPLRSLPCRIAVGTVTGSLSTTWGTIGANIFTAGTGTLTVEPGPTPPLRVGARAGTPAGGSPRVQLMSETATRRYTVTVPYPDPTWFLPFSLIGTHALVAPPHTATLLETDLSTTPPTNVRTYELGQGVWTFDAAGASGADPVAATFSATLYVAP